MMYNVRPVVQYKNKKPQISYDRISIVPNFQMRTISANFAQRMGTLPVLLKL